MNKFSPRSFDRLSTCTQGIQKVMRKVVKIYDITVVFGYRGEDAQTKAYNKGNSKLRWPNSKHNTIPSKAIDIIPYPSGWPDRSSPHYEKQIAAFYYMAGVVIGVADSIGVKLRWGGDWDRDDEFIDQTFDDLSHFEEVDP